MEGQLIVLSAGFVLASFIITFASMPMIISLSVKKGYFDNPGDALKVHEKPIPYLGGLGIFGGFMLPLLFLCFAPGSPGEFMGILLGGLVIVGLGTWDDLKNLKPSIRLAGQLLAAMVAVYFGIKINTFPSYYVAVPLTAFCIVGSVNAVNLFDGLDGLAGGVVAITLAGFSVVFYSQGNIPYLLVSLALLGSVSGFLPHNFNPARIFMGDNGSTFLGYMVALMAVKACREPYDLKLFAASMLLIGLPVIDTAAAAARRFLKGRPVFVGDRSHIYDRMVDRGLSVRQTALLCYALQAVIVGGAVYLYSLS